MISSGMDRLRAVTQIGDYGWDSKRKVEMIMKVRLAAIFLEIAAMFPLVPGLRAQAPAAPIPSQILGAKKVFISNAGGPFEKEMWSGEPSRAYNDFYAAIKAWGYYEIVGTPAEADLILQVSLAMNYGESARIRLAALEPKTNTTLWAFDEWVPEKPYKGIVKLKNARDNDFEGGMNRIVNDLKALTTPPQITHDPK